MDLCFPALREAIVLPMSSALAVPTLGRTGYNDVYISARRREDTGECGFCQLWVGKMEVVRIDLLNYLGLMVTRIDAGRHNVTILVRLNSDASEQAGIYHRQGPSVGQDDLVNDITN